MKKIKTSPIADKVVQALSDTDNIVPYEIKRTFSFKGRKSPEIINKVICALTDQSDYILDPFLGTGMTLIASQEANRKFLGIELDNYTYSVDQALFEKVDSKILNKYFEDIKDAVMEKVMDLYETTFEGEKNYIKKILFDPQNGKEGFYSPTPNRDIKDGRNVILINKSTKGLNSKKFEDVDWKKIQEIKKIDVSRFPDDTLYENSRINITRSTGADKFGTFFSQRNKVALLLLQDEISKLPSSKEKNFLQHVLVSSLALAKITMYSSSTDILYHVVSEKAQDMNVWYLFEEKFKRFIKFQEKYSNILTDDFGGGEAYKVIHSDYFKYLNKNKDLKFDAIVTDFPYTDQVPYLERNQLFRIWLKHFDKSKDFTLSNEMLENEIVITNAPKRKQKNLNNYFNDIDKMFKVFSEHLIEGGQVIIFSKLGKMKYFNVFARIIDYARKNGFEYTFRVGLEKNDPTLRKQSAYKNTLINEVVIGFQKLSEDMSYLYIDDENYERKIVDDIYHQLKKVDDKSYTLTAALSRIKSDLARKKIRWSDKLQEKIIKIIKDNFYVENHDIQLDKTRLYLDQEDETTLFKKLYELVPIYVADLLEKNGKFVLEELYIDLIDELSDGNNKTLYALLNDDRNIKQIDDLVSEMTDKSLDGNYYIRKQLPKDFDKDAIDISTMDPYAFEDLCKQLLEKENFNDVHRKGGSGDLGVDIVAKKFSDQTSDIWLVQCKRWVSNVDATPIQRLIAERERLSADKVACYTTSGFSKDAKKIARDQNVELIDGKNLLLKLNQYFPGKFYNSNLIR